MFLFPQSRSSLALYKKNLKILSKTETVTHFRKIKKVVLYLLKTEVSKKFISFTQGKNFPYIFILNQNRNH